MSAINVYYTDDDEDDLLLFSDAIDKIIEDLNIQVNLHLFNNGNDFFENLQNINSSNTIIFLDINMPCKSGLQILQELRSQPATKRIPTIMFSTSSDSISISKCQWLGATHYAIKPSDFNFLIKTLASLITIDWNTYKAENELFLIR